MNRPVERPVPAAGPVDFDRYIDDRIDEGQFAVHRDIFRDEFLFELEMKYIFESNWVFLCHASQLPKPHDFFSTYIGRQPVLVTRNAGGELKAFLNTCTHKGSLVCLNRSGNRKFHSCTYHGWTFDTNGRCVSIKDHAEAAYTPAFEAHSHDLQAVPKLA
ncbi:MAG: aromatic ring-hydroxylating oxygenase subunit alpha, partial [Gammaproteobacteria bacterium]